MLRTVDLVFAILGIAAVLPAVCHAQQAQASPQQGSGMSGIASGVVAAPVYDEKRRPITAGGFVDKGPVVFEDITKQAGLSGWTHKMGVSEKKFIVETNGSSVCFIDYDNDGWLDLFMVNGHVYPQVDQHDWGTTFAERPLLFHNVPERRGKGRRFEFVPPVTGTGLAVVVSARGAAFGDLFNHGKMDVVINPIDGPPVLLRNVNPDHHHWVELSLVGSPKSPRHATCATGYLTANGMRQRQDVLASGSYISSNDRRLHFGLGDATDPGSLEIHWPSGRKETVELPAADRIYTITEGVGITGELCGGKPCAENRATGKAELEAHP